MSDSDSHHSSRRGSSSSNSSKSSKSSRRSSDQQETKHGEEEQRDDGGVDGCLAQQEVQEAEPDHDSASDSSHSDGGVEGCIAQQEMQEAEPDHASDSSHSDKDLRATPHEKDTEEQSDTSNSCDEKEDTDEGSKGHSDKNVGEVRNDEDVQTAVPVEEEVLDQTIVKQECSFPESVLSDFCEGPWEDIPKQETVYPWPTQIEEGEEGQTSDDTLSTTGDDSGRVTPVEEMLQATSADNRRPVIDFDNLGSPGDQDQNQNDLADRKSSLSDGDGIEKRDKEKSLSPTSVRFEDDRNSIPNSPLAIEMSVQASGRDDSQIRSPFSDQRHVNAEVHISDDTFNNGVTKSQSSGDSSLILFDRHQGHFVVVAIDFGTTFSGYAFSFTRDPKSIHMMRKWEGGDPGVINQKTPTTLLLDPEGRFHSFGFTARDFYHDLDPQESRKWLYFEKFKMMLHHNANLGKDTMLTATNGKQLSAVAVFSHALRFFRDHALQELSDQSSIKILNEDVRWVITVPAIWKQPAKQFMRQAAYDAGIACEEFPDQLLIALEPEAASIYCRRLRMYQLVPDAPVRKALQSPKREQTEPMNLDPVVDETPEDSYVIPTTPEPVPPPRTSKNETVENIVRGTRYIVVDCGGGTVDLTVHELEEGPTGKLKEIHKATGGPYGSVGVDREFEKLLVSIFGNEFIEQFRQKRPAGYVDLMIAFESRKRAASPYKNNPLNVSLPFSFIDYYKKCKGNQVENAVRKYGDKDVRWSSQGMLRLTSDAMIRLFRTTLDKIKQTIGDVLNHPDAKDIKYMFLVGGFAESPLLQYEIKKDFGGILRVIIPQDMGLCILKGAVLFGLDPTIVSIRKSRLTYGVGVLNRYVEGRHPKSKKVTRDGISWCTDVFDKFVSADQSVALGNTVLRSYTPAKPGQSSVIINIYCTDRSDVRFITDSGVRKCGTLCLDFSEWQYHHSQPRRREIQARMLFGDTEIKVSALDVSSGKCVKAAIDFLNK